MQIIGSYNASNRKPYFHVVFRDGNGATGILSRALHNPHQQIIDRMRVRDFISLDDPELAEARQDIGRRVNESLGYHLTHVIRNPVFSVDMRVDRERGNVSKLMVCNPHFVPMSYGSDSIPLDIVHDAILRNQIQVVDGVVHFRQNMMFNCGQTYVLAGGNVLRKMSRVTL